MEIDFDEAQRQWRRNKIDLGGECSSIAAVILKFCKAPPRRWSVVHRPKSEFHSYPRSPGPCKYHFNLSFNFN